MRVAAPAPRPPRLDRPLPPRRASPWWALLLLLLAWTPIANAAARSSPLRGLQEATESANAHVDPSASANANVVANAAVASAVAYANVTVDATTNGTLQLPASSRLINVTLSMGCPEFLSAFYEANVSSTTPYRAFSITKGAGYGYVALHFPQLWLPPGASMVLHAVEDVNVPDRYFNLTDVAFPSGTLYTDVFAPPMLARELVVELYRDVGPAALASLGRGRDNADGNDNGSGSGRGRNSDAPSAVEVSANANADASLNDRHCYGFVVDTANYVLADVARNITPSNEAVCANDNSREAACYYEDTNTRSEYLAARAVARLLIQREDGKASACTGWLLGSEGHLMTNYHCVNSSAQAAATTVEFMADAPSCASSCTEWGACAGTVEAISTTLVRANAALDYALLKLQTNVNLPAKYGYLRLKATQGSVGQEIYIPQHPLFYGKRIAMLNDFGTKTTILSTAADGCGATGYSYNGDTQAGSSGSPVVDAQDHGVVALHHCGQFCANTGIPSTSILADLQAANALPANAVDTGDKKNAARFPSWQPPEAVAPRTLRPALTFNGAITRDAAARTVSVDQFEFVLAADADVSFDVLSAEVSDDGVFQDLNGDCAASYLDAIIFLYRAGDSRAVLTKDDDKNGKGRGDGSTSARDPHARTFLKSGTYVLALAAMPANATTAFAGVVPMGRDDPEIYSCVAHAATGAYRIQFQSSEELTFNRLPQAVVAPTGGGSACAVPASAICAF